jgi:hypothetical protein
MGLIKLSGSDMNHIKGQRDQFREALGTSVWIVHSLHLLLSLLSRGSPSLEDSRITVGDAGLCPTDQVDRIKNAWRSTSKRALSRYREGLGRRARFLSEGGLTYRKMSYRYEVERSLLSMTDPPSHAHFVG